MQRRFHYVLMVLLGASLFLVACGGQGSPPMPTPTPTSTPTPPLISVPMPNLVVETAAIDFDTETVSISMSNTGDADAGEHLTHVEINSVDADDVLKPQCQYEFNADGIDAGSTWSPNPILFTSFSCPPARGSLDPSSLTTANLVVIIDGKNTVAESNESDNISDTVQDQ